MTFKEFILRAFQGQLIEIMIALIIVLVFVWISYKYFFPDELLPEEQRT